MSYKKRGVLSVFDKSYEEKKKNNPILVYPGLRYTHKKKFQKCFLSTKINLRLKKKDKQIFEGNFKNIFARQFENFLSSPSKKC